MLITKKFNKRTFNTLLVIFPIAIISKIFQYNFLGPKYFNDSKYILGLLSNNIEKKGTAFYTTAEIFNAINIFHLESLVEWSIFLSAIFSVIMFILLLKENKYNKYEYIFIYVCMILLNIYVFNLSKDIIQLVAFSIIYIITVSSKLNKKRKIVLILIVFLFESITFRPYYILIGYSFIFAYFVLKNMMKFENKKFVRFFILSTICFLISIKLVEFISPKYYNDVTNVRDKITADLIANTEITNIIKGDNFFSFSANYVINLVRILIPIELLLKGASYLPFVVYQLYVTYIVIKNVKCLNKSNILSVSVVIGYFMASVTFEPDFGSVVRHETTLTMLYVSLNHNLYNVRLKPNIEETKNEKS